MEQGAQITNAEQSKNTDAPAPSSNSSAAADTNEAPPEQDQEAQNQDTAAELRQKLHDVEEKLAQATKQGAKSTSTEQSANAEASASSSSSSANTGTNEDPAEKEKEAQSQARKERRRKNSKTKKRKMAQARLGPAPFQQEAPNSSREAIELGATVAGLHQLGDHGGASAVIAQAGWNGLAAATSKTSTEKESKKLIFQVTASRTIEEALQLEGAPLNVCTMEYAIGTFMLTEADPTAGTAATYNTERFYCTDKISPDIDSYKNRATAYLTKEKRFKMGLSDEEPKPERVCPRCRPFLFAALAAKRKREEEEEDEEGERTGSDGDYA